MELAAKAEQREADTKNSLRAAQSTLGDLRTELEAQRQAHDEALQAAEASHGAACMRAFGLALACRPYQRPRHQALRVFARF